MLPIYSVGYWYTHYLLLFTCSVSHIYKCLQGMMARLIMPSVVKEYLFLSFLPSVSPTFDCRDYEERRGGMDVEEVRD